FIITPPLFKLSPTKNNVLRIVNTSDALPQDRESVYWVNVKSIPARSEDAENKNVLQIAVRTRLKLFYRPAGLKGNSMD
ncbi:fimbria/pilus periplasmic chaperone, partial [Paenibacillus polymyxa]|nr:fimbria/pilus periplasmic chaperone [Paenibacillus polymyxa]